MLNKAVVKVMNRRLALFDLDNTLLAGDSDHAWGEFLISRGLVDESEHRRANDGFYADYLAGRLDIHAWIAFTLEPVRGFSAAGRDSLLAEFIHERVRPMVLSAGRELVARHRRAGDLCLILTATNDLITRPIAALFGVDELLATEAELVDGGITGRIRGTPCFREGKVTRLRDWLARSGADASIANSVFYSDSMNDLALLELAGEAVAVDPDDGLRRVARERGWKIISLRPPQAAGDA